MLKVVIFGAGGLGREVLVLLRDMAAAGHQVDCIGFVVDQSFEAPESVHGVPVFKGLSHFAGTADVQFVVALGPPAQRRQSAAAIESVVGPRFATIVHPTAWVGAPVTIGAGTVVMGQASITTDVRIGQHVLINPQVSIAHDCVLENFCTLAPAVALAGGVQLREGCELGTGARIVPRQVVGQWSMVGAGAVVISAVAANTTVVGMPARKIAEHPLGWHDSMHPMI